MEIRNYTDAAVKTYRDGAANLGGAGTAKDLGKARPLNADKVEFSSPRTVDSAKAEVSSAIERGASMDRLRNLASAYAGEACPTNSIFTASFILGA